MKVILDKSFKGWILEGIVLEARSFATEPIEVIYCEPRFTVSALPNIIKSLFLPFRIYPGDLVVNQNTLVSLVKWRHIRHRDLQNIRVFFSHPKEEIKDGSRFHHCLKSSAEIIVMNSHDSKMLSQLGISEKNIKIGYGGIDESRFFPCKENDKTSGGYILVSGDYKKRKRPDLVIDIVLKHKELNFLITGRGWKDFLDKKGISLNNLEIQEFTTEKNPEIIRHAKCLMSLAAIEGGPYPVMEALASGTPVLGTRTGWIPDLVNHKNGRIVELDDELDKISIMLLECIELKESIKHLNCLYGDFSWEKYSQVLFPRESRN